MQQITIDAQLQKIMDDSQLKPQEKQVKAGECIAKYAISKQLMGIIIGEQHTYNDDRYEDFLSSFIETLLNSDTYKRIAIPVEGMLTKTSENGRYINEYDDKTQEAMEKKYLIPHCPDANEQLFPGGYSLTDANLTSEKGKYVGYVIPAKLLTKLKKKFKQNITIQGLEEETQIDLMYKYYDLTSMHKKGVPWADAIHYAKNLKHILDDSYADVIDKRMNVPIKEQDGNKLMKDMESLSGNVSYFRSADKLNKRWAKIIEKSSLGFKVLWIAIIGDGHVKSVRNYILNKENILVIDSKLSISTVGWCKDELQIPQKLFK